MFINIFKIGYVSGWKHVGASFMISFCTRYLEPLLEDLIESVWKEIYS